jgi:glycerophosphoryl diester phosphodiesterase
MAMLTTVAGAGGPIVIAHRGASGYLPEHTLEAVAVAHAQGADFIEQDLVLSKDRVPVVLHDVQIDTVTDVARRFPTRHRDDGRFYAIDFTLAELKTLRVHERIDLKTGKAALPSRFPLGLGVFRIPTLDEELDLIAGLNSSTGRRAGVYPEIKAPKWHRDQGYDISPIVLEVLARRGYATKDDPCHLQCFEFEEVRRIREELGYRGLLIQLLGGGKGGPDGTDATSAEGLAILARYVDGIGPAISLVVRTGDGDGDASEPTDLVRLAHAAKLKVHPYTVRVDALPKGQTAGSLLHALFVDAGVDGVFADHPDKVVEYLRDQAQAQAGVGR